MPGVLIVDDKPANLFLLRAGLTGYRCEVEEARDAGAALAEARQHPPVLLIVSLHLPGGGSDALLRDWRADDTLRHIPAVAYGAYGVHGDRTDEAQHALDLGAAAYLPRPADPGTFLAHLRRVLDGDLGATLPANTDALHDERGLLREYSRMLVRTLEEKVLDLERSNRELAGREAVYQEIFDGNPQPMWMYDLQTLRFLAVNDAAVAQYGYAREEFLAMTIKDIRPPEDVPALLEAVASVTTGLSEPQDWRHRRRDGAVINVEITSHTMEFQGRRAELVMARDVTARKHLEDRSVRQRGALIALTGHRNRVAGELTAELRQIVEVAARTLNVARVSVWRYTPDRATIKCVDLFDSTIGQHSAGAALSAAMYPAYFAAVATAEVIAADDAIHNPHTGEFGEDYLEPLGIGSMLDVPTNVGGVRDGVLSHEHVGPARQWTEDEKTFAVAMGNLVSLALEAEERRRAEAQQRLSEERFRELAETIQEVFWIAEPDSNRVLYVSPAFEDVWGRTCQSLYEAPESWAATIHPEDRDRVLRANALQLDGHYDEEYRIVRPDGAVRWIRDQAFPVRHPSGHVERVVGVARDITERRELETQYRQAQKMEAIGQLAGGVAHDFNNILTAIQFNASLLESTDGLPPEALECARDIENAVQRAAALTRQLLTFGRKQVMQQRDLDLNAVVTDVATMLRRIIGEDVGLDVRCAAGALPVRADPGMVEQILMNLVVNARDAMPRGGTIVIETAEVEVDGTRYARLSVRDTGSGMTPEVRAHIFEPFFTTKGVGRGTGLGLAMVHGIVQQHHGYVEVDTEPGQGTELKIYLPYLQDSTPRPAAAPSPAAPHAPAATGQTILVVEDEPGVRVLEQTILQRARYRVLAADSGAAALALWREHRDAIRLVITDIVMPEGMTGVELVALLRQECPSLPVLFTSGYAPDAVREHVELVEGVNFLTKPFTAARLLDVVRARLDGSLRPGT